MCLYLSEYALVIPCNHLVLSAISKINNVVGIKLCKNQLVRNIFETLFCEGSLLYHNLKTLDIRVPYKLSDLDISKFSKLVNIHSFRLEGSKNTLQDINFILDTYYKYGTKTLKNLTLIRCKFNFSIAGLIPICKGLVNLRIEACIFNNSRHSNPNFFENFLYRDVIT